MSAAWRSASAAAASASAFSLSARRASNLQRAHRSGIHPHPPLNPKPYTLHPSLSGSTMQKPCPGPVLTSTPKP